jgi:hypothetical protein
MGRCINPSLGKLLHAYELKSLSPQEEEQFELHLLECDYCFNEVSSMADEIGALLYDDSVKETTAELARQPIQSGDQPAGLWRYLWPLKTPFVFRPAFIYTLLVIALIPAFIGLNLTSGSRVRPIQSIGLVQVRSAEIMSLDRSKGSDAIVNFILDSYTNGDNLSVTIRSTNGEIVYNDNDFIGMDERGIGRLYIAIDKFKEGKYTLEVVNKQKAPPLDKNEFQFMIR